MKKKPIDLKAKEISFEEMNHNAYVKNLRYAHWKAGQNKIKRESDSVNITKPETNIFQLALQVGRLDLELQKLRLEEELKIMKIKRGESWKDCV